MKWLSPLRAVIVCTAMLLVFFGYAHFGKPYAFFGTPLAGQPAPPLHLQSDENRPFSLSARHGRAVLVYFGYTHCPDVCPTTLAALHAVFAQLSQPDARQVDVVFVTLDPVRDTPSLLRAYLAAFDPVPIGLTGSARDVARTASDWGVSWQLVDDGEFINHTSVITLVGPDGRMRARYGFAQLDNSAAMAGDIRHVLQAE